MGKNHPEFQQNPAWIKYFRQYKKDLRKIKNQVYLRGELRFNCTQCGLCCNFSAQKYRCLLSWADVARWHEARFYLGLFFVFPAHSIDGYSALGIPTKIEVRSGKFLEWIRPLDDGGRLISKFPLLIKQLTRFLGNVQFLQGEEGTCIYLGSDHRCLIHALRPGACRLFPYMQKNIIQISQNTLPTFSDEPSVPCPPEAFIAEKSFPEDVQQIIHDCTEAEAAAWAQERVSLAEVENLLVEIWREILPKH